MHLVARIVERLVPALLLAGGVTLLMAGLLSFASPPPSGGADAPAATPAAGDPALTPDALPPSAAPTRPASPGRTYQPYLPGASPPLSPTGQPTPGSEPTPALHAPATRIAIPSLRIDLAVVPGDLPVPGNRDNYPLCDVAQYLLDFGQPGQDGTTYIYAHAQRGMFLPMLRASTRDDGSEMIGALVEVYTGDARLHLYEIYLVKRHATDLSLAFNVSPGEQRLVLQTSEGPEGTIPKLQVAARPIGVIPSSPEEAVPDARPRACPPN